MKQIICAALAINLAGSALAQAPVAAPAGTVMGTFGSGPPPVAPLPGAPVRSGPAKIPARGISIELALKAAKATVAACVGKHIGVAVLDQSGQAKLIYIPDGSTTEHAFTAFRKANSALLIGAPSNQLYARATADKGLAAKVLGNPNYIIWGGGQPIIVKGEVIGAIGVSGGGPEGIDDGCAKAGLAAIQKRLK